MISSSPDRAIRSFMRRLTGLITLKYALSFLTLWSFGWGIAALVWRVTAGLPRWWLWVGIVGALLAVGLAVVLAQRRRPTRATVSALLDQQSHCGGLLMASGEARLGEWRDRMPEPRLPRLRWRAARAWALLAASAVFVIVSLVAPVRWASMNAGRTLDVGSEAQKLAAEIEMLKEEKLLSVSQAETLEQKLDQVKAEAEGTDPAKTWEALDHLSGALDRAAKEAAENAAAKAERLKQAEALAEGLQTGASAMSPQLTTEAMQTLAEMMKKAAEENQSLAQNLSAETQAAMKSGSFTPEQLKEMAKALKQNKAALNAQLSKLNQAGMIDGKNFKSGGQADNAGLAQFLKENANKMSVSDAVGQWCEGGKGGVDRGRGDAAMTWTDGSSEKGAKFKEQVLSPAALAGLSESQLLGLSAGAPTVGQNKTVSAGALNTAAPGGGSAYTQTILPRHKGAVKRYFDRPQGK